MILQIDTENFQIAIHENINLGELFDLLNKFFPSENWRKFAITYFPVREPNYPIIINPVYPYPWYIPPVITYLTSDTSMTYDDIAHASTTEPPILNPGIYKVEIK